MPANAQHVSDSSAAPPHTDPGPLELLVIQPTPFCNINCTYCYLPERQSTRRMSFQTLEATWRWVFASGVVGILLALYLWASLPVTAVWLLGLLLGIQLICEGAALGYLAWKVRTS